jgi:hypothetical protein
MPGTVAEPWVLVYPWLAGCATHLMQIRHMSIDVAVTLVGAGVVSEVKMGVQAIPMLPLSSLSFLGTPDTS